VLALKKLVLLSAPVVALAVLTAPTASAETLIYVTASTIGTVDSSAPATDNTAGGNGPLSYALPAGFTTIGAKVSIDSQGLFLLGSNGGTCQLYAVNPSGSGGVAGITAVDASYNCSGKDFAFLNGTGLGEQDAYLIADGANVLGVPAGGGTLQSYVFSNQANIQGVVDVNSSPNDTQYGVDASTQELVQLNFDTTTFTGTETDVSALSVNSTPVVFSGSTSLDFSILSDTFYVYTGGALYAVAGVFSGTPTVAGLGAAPGGTLAMTVAANGNVSVSNNVKAGGGAFTPAALLPLLGMAWLRRKRVRVQA